MDDPSSSTWLLAVIGAGASSYLFALAVGLANLRDAHLAALAEGEGLVARTAERFDRGRERALASVHIAHLGFGIATFAELWFAVRDGIANGYAVVGLGVLYLLVAQVLAAVARRRAGAPTLRAYAVMRPALALLSPLVWPVAFIAQRVAELFPGDHLIVDRGRVAELAVEQVLEEGEEDGSIAEDQAALLWNVLEFKDTVVREVMVPRTNVVAIDVETDLEQVLGIVIEHAHSRYPVFRGSKDQVEGILYAKDLFRAFREGAGLDGLELADIVRRPSSFVSESAGLASVLREMQASRVHLAVVTDEFGGVAGIVTLEDILEEIVGEIHDEHEDVNAGPIRRVGEAHYVVDASVSIDDLNERLSQPVSSPDEVDSMGGLAVSLAGRVPSAGERYEVGDYELCVLDADAQRVRVLEIYPSSEDDTAAAS